MKTVSSKHEEMVGKKAVVKVGRHWVPGIIVDTIEDTGGQLCIAIRPQFAHNCCHEVVANWHTEFTMQSEEEVQAFQAAIDAAGRKMFGENWK